MIQLMKMRQIFYCAKMLQISQENWTSPICFHLKTAHYMAIAKVSDILMLKVQKPVEVPLMIRLLFPPVLIPSLLYRGVSLSVYFAPN